VVILRLTILNAILVLSWAFSFSQEQALKAEFPFKHTVHTYWPEKFADGLPSGDFAYVGRVRKGEFVVSKYSSEFSKHWETRLSVEEDEVITQVFANPETIYLLSYDDQGIYCRAFDCSDGKVTKSKTRIGTYEEEATFSPDRAKILVFDYISNGLFPIGIKYKILQGDLTPLASNQINIDEEPAVYVFYPIVLNNGTVALPSVSLGGSAVYVHHVDLSGVERVIKASTGIDPKVETILDLHLSVLSDNTLIVGGMREGIKKGRITGVEVFEMNLGQNTIVMSARYKMSEDVLAQIRYKKKFGLREIFRHNGSTIAIAECSYNMSNTFSKTTVGGAPYTKVWHYDVIGEAVVFAFDSTGDSQFATVVNNHAPRASPTQFHLSNDFVNFITHNQFDDGRSVYSWSIELKTGKLLEPKVIIDYKGNFWLKPEAVVHNGREEMIFFISTKYASDYITGYKIEF